MERGLFYYALLNFPVDASQISQKSSELPLNEEKESKNALTLLLSEYLRIIFPLMYHFTKEYVWKHEIPIFKAAFLRETKLEAVFTTPL